MRRLPAVLAIAILGATACSGSATRETVAQECGTSGKAADYLSSAKTAFTGVMLRGPADSGKFLLSPARIRVSRYLKGRGPSIAIVETAYQDGGSAVNGEDITPKAGERWTVYSTSAHGPYQTSICAGSARER